MSTAAPEFEYDADRDPDPQAWLAASFTARTRGVRRYHERHGGVEAGSSIELHTAVHVAVENQIALGKPAVTGATLRRLRDEGMARHDAIHAIGKVVGANFLAVIEAGRLFDEGSLGRQLERIATKPGA